MADMAGASGAVWAFTEHEHREIPAGINRIHDVACGIGGWATPELSLRVVGVLAWLDRELEPHVSWEESWLYPEIEPAWARRGRPGWPASIIARSATWRPGSRADQGLLDHDRMPERLVELRAPPVRAPEALLRAHIEREERYLISLLADDASPDPPTDAVAGSATAG